MQGFPQRLKELQTAVAENQRRFAQELDFSDTRIINYIKHGTEPPARLVSNILSRYPHVDPRWLLTGEGEMFEHPDEAQQRGGVFKGVPVVGHIEAGQLVERYTNEHTEEYIQFDASEIAPPGDLLFGLRIKGRSMEQWMFEGDVAICSATQEARPGDDVCFYQFQTGESTVKRLDRYDKQAGRIDLRPMNPLFQKFSAELEQGDQIKKVVGIWRDYRLIKRERNESF